MPFRREIRYCPHTHSNEKRVLIAADPRQLAYSVERVRQILAKAALAKHGGVVAQEQLEEDQGERHRKFCELMSKFGGDCARTHDVRAREPHAWSKI